MKTVRVYKNLRTGTLSMQEKIGGKWKVTAYPVQVTLQNARFYVSENGRKRVLKTGHKNVHAWIQGTLLSQFYASDNASISEIVNALCVDSLLTKKDAVTYNPKKMKSFTKVKNGDRIESADYVDVFANGRIYCC